MPVTFDTDTPPFVFIRAEGDIYSEDIEGYFAQRYQDFGLTAPYVQVFDANSFRGMGFAERHLFASHMKKVAKNYGTLSRGAAFVLESAAMRGIIRAIQWTAPPVNPTKFFKEMEDAKDWAKGQLSTQDLATSLAERSAPLYTPIGARNVSRNVQAGR